MNDNTDSSGDEVARLRPREYHRMQRFTEAQHFRITQLVLAQLQDAGEQQSMEDLVQPAVEPVPPIGKPVPPAI